MDVSGEVIDAVFGGEIDLGDSDNRLTDFVSQITPSERSKLKSEIALKTQERKRAGRRVTRCEVCSVVYVKTLDTNKHGIWLGCSGGCAAWVHR